MHEGERLVDRAVRLLREAGCAPVVVVLGAWQGEVPGADRVVINPDWPSGMSSSLRCGLAQFAADSPSGPRAVAVDRVLITLVDLVGLTADAARRVIDSPARIAAAAYDGQRGHPVLIGVEHLSDVMAGATGDRGARDFLQAVDVALVEVADVAGPEDLDIRPA